LEHFQPSFSEVSRVKAFIKAKPSIVEAKTLKFSFFSRIFAVF